MTFVQIDDAGTLVAAGSPERVVRLWDPRAAGSQDGQSIAGLIGHTDNIRAILLSQDGRHVSLSFASAPRCAKEVLLIAVPVPPGNSFCRRVPIVLSSALRVLSKGRSIENKLTTFHR